MANKKPVHTSQSKSRLRWLVEHILLVLILSIIPLAVLYIHYSAYRTWTNSTYLEQHGVTVMGEVTDSYESSSARSGPNYYVTFSYNVNGFEFVSQQQVDQATYVLHDEGDDVVVLYDPDNPYRADIKGNDYRSLTTFVIVILDGALIGVGVYIWRSSRPKRVLPPPED